MSAPLLALEKFKLHLYNLEAIRKLVDICRVLDLLYLNDKAKLTGVESAYEIPDGITFKEWCFKMICSCYQDHMLLSG